jgi:hypothetical protein
LASTKAACMLLIIVHCYNDKLMRVPTLRMAIMLPMEQYAVKNSKANPNDVGLVSWTFALMESTMMIIIRN